MELGVSAVSEKVRKVKRTGMSENSDDDTEIQRSRPRTPAARRPPPPDEGTNGGILSASEAVLNLLSNLEKRLETCNSVYTLATNVSLARDKERELAEATLMEALHDFESRLAAMESALDSIPHVVKRTVEKEFSHLNTHGKVQELLLSLTTTVDSRLTELETAVAQRAQLHTKSIKAAKRELALIQVTPRDNASVDELASAVAELTQKQNALAQLLDGVRSGGR
jgi:hypothetical protein